MTPVGNTTPSFLTNTIGRFRPPLSPAGGKHAMTSLHLTSTLVLGSVPKYTIIGWDLRFSPYSVSCLPTCGFGLDMAARAAAHVGLGTSAARSGARYLTKPGKGVIGFEGTPENDETGLSYSTGGTKKLYRTWSVPTIVQTAVSLVSTLQSAPEESSFSGRPVAAPPTEFIRRRFLGIGLVVNEPEIEWRLCIRRTRPPSLEGG